MTNPFEDENAEYIVLKNDECQYSLWPKRIAVPKGWAVARTVGSRKECLAWIEETWTDMRPKSLIDKMSASARTRLSATE